MTLAFLSSLDHQLFFAVHKLQKFNLDPLLAWPTQIVSQWYLVPGLLILTLLQSRERILSRSMAAVFPILLAHAGAEVMKGFFAVPRPFTFFSENPGAVNVLFEAPHTFSFPSGHACNAFAAAVILSSWFGVPRPAAFGLALLLSLTRLYIGVHFPSDILAGGVWGFAITALWVHLLEKRGFVFHRRKLSH